MRWLWIGFSSFAFLACSGKDEHPQTVPPDTGKGGVTNLGSGGGAGKATGGGGTAGAGGNEATGGKAGGGETGEGGEGGSGDVNDLAPVVEIVSPAEVLNPNGKAIITITDTTSENVAVTCRATPSSAPGATAVNSSSVTITALDEAGAELDQKPGQLTSDSDYKATLTLDTAANGPVMFMCEAYDKSKVPVKGSAQAWTFVDRGPTIDDVVPNEPHPVAGGTHFEFTVTPAPLWADADVGAAVGAVTLTVNNVAITTLAADPKRPDTYVADVDFLDRALYPVTPSGTIPFTITAANKRKPVPATRTGSYTFELDGTGPVIAITSPTDRTVIVGGPKPRPIVFTVQDSGSGVDPSSVVVGLNSSTYRYSATDPSWSLVKPAKKTDPYTFTYLVDATKFTDATVQVTLNIDAKDVAGNGAVGKSLLMNIDNQPPLVSLDPPKVRLITNTSTTRYCSKAFDPLGEEAVSDTENVGLLPLFRAFILERTNTADGLKLLVFSGVDPVTPHLYLQNDPAKGVIIDTNNDGICDAINPELKGTTRSIALDPIPAVGAGDTNAGVNLSDDPPVPSDWVCTPRGVDVKGLCGDNGSDLDAVAGEFVQVGDTLTNLSAIWGVQVGAPQSLTCTGRQWELSPSFAKEGWQCLAGSASDMVGNEGISPPLRVCFDEPGNDTQPACAVSSTTPPSCTDGCTPPNAAFNPLLERRE